MQRLKDDFSNAETETVMPYGTNDLTVAEMHEVLSELCLLLKVSVVRTNETKHGHVELQVRHEVPEPPQAPAPADARAEIARLRGALEALEADAHLIFNNPPSECPQIARDVIEWYASSIRVALDTK